MKKRRRHSGMSAKKRFSLSLKFLFSIEKNTVYTIAAVILTLLFLLIPACQGKRSVIMSDEAAAGEAYIEAEISKDPAEANAQINAVKEADAEKKRLEAEAAAAEEAKRQQEAAEAAAAEEAAQKKAAIEAAMGGPEEQLPFDDFQGYYAYLKNQIDTLTLVPLSDAQIAQCQARFMDAVIIGDSMTEAMYSYSLLDKDNVWYQRGAAIDELYDEVNGALNMYPNKMIFYTGLNDISYYNNAAEYKASYQDMISYIKSKRPDLKIYICSVLPASNEKAALDPKYQEGPQFDEAVREICAENGLEYIDIMWMVRQELYYEDGIHFQYSFDQVLLQYITLYINS